MIRQKDGTHRLETRVTGLRPHQADLSHLYEPVIVDIWPGMRDEGSSCGGAYPAHLPSSFDWVDQGGVTPVKDQGSCPACWMFGTIGDLECRILIDWGIELDLSEQQVKECNIGIRGCQGGTALAGAAYVTKNAVSLETAGPDYAYDDEDPEPLGSACPSGDKSEFRFVVTEYQQEPLNTITAIQDDIYNHGPLQTDMNPSVLRGYSGGCIHNENGGNGHTVLITGWDDNMDCDPDTGGWICRNQYGTDWGEDGYFNIAYDSGGIGGNRWRATAFKEWSDDEDIYYYDEGGWGNQIGYGNDTAYACVKYKAVKDTWITHVFFWTAGHSTRYSVKLYDSFDGTDLGNLLTSEAGSCGAGYYTVALTTPQYFSKGSEIVVVNQIETSRYNFPICVDNEDTDYCDIESAKCYTSDDGSKGSWTDTSQLDPSADVCLGVWGVKKGANVFTTFKVRNRS